MNGEERGESLRGCAEDELAEVFQQQRDSDGRDEHGELGTVAERAVGESLNRDAKQRADNHRARQRVNPVSMDSFGIPRPM